MRRVRLRLRIGPVVTAIKKAPPPQLLLQPGLGARWGLGGDGRLVARDDSYAD